MQVETAAKWTIYKRDQPASSASHVHKRASATLSTHNTHHDTHHNTTHDTTHNTHHSTTHDTTHDTHHDS